MADYQKPLPSITEDSKEYWAGCRRHELLIQRCDSCGRFQFYPRCVCTNCLSEDLAWVKVSGKGQVYSFSVIHRAPTKAFASDVPYVTALIELQEGVRMMSTVVGCPPDEVTIGMQVVVTFDDVTPEISLPRFQPVHE